MYLIVSGRLEVVDCCVVIGWWRSGRESVCRVYMVNDG